MFELSAAMLSEPGLCLIQFSVCGIDLSQPEIRGHKILIRRPA
jgi:hypothetical protein